MILLTGATGTAGSFIANEFTEQRVPVRILVRDKTKAKRFENTPTVEIVEGDMSVPSALGALPRRHRVKGVGYLAVPADQLIGSRSKTSIAPAMRRLEEEREIGRRDPAPLPRRGPSTTT
jgi:nucleoside-diphosphate-sugar epimerase